MTSQSNLPPYMRAGMPYPAPERLAKIDPWATKPTLKKYPVFLEPENAYDPELAKQLTNEQVGAALERHAWTYAKSMPQWPHHYVVRHQWQPLPGTTPPWENVVQHMREHGKAGWFKSWGRQTARIYFVQGGFVYWTMGCELKVTSIINKQPDVPATYYYYDPES